MRALTVSPGHSGSLRVTEVPDPSPGPHELLVDGLALGICGTDKEIARGEYGWAPPGRDRLVLGHESLGRVAQAPGGSRFSPGDLVVGVVRRPDPVPCGACGAGEFDMCRNGRYTERGIKEIDGYGSERWTVDERYAIPLDKRLADVGVLMEPTSVVAKAWEQVWRVGERAWFGANAFGEQGDDLGIQRIGLGQPAGGAGKVADLARVDDGQRQARAGESGRNREFEAAGCLEHNQRRGQDPQIADQLLETLVIVCEREGLPRRTYMNIKTILGDIDADEVRHGGRLFHHPSCLLYTSDAADE